MAVREKLRAVTRDLGGQARVARALGVSPSRVSRWLRTEQPDPENRRKVEGLEFVLSQLLDVFDRDVAIDWLQGSNPFLGNHRPIERIARGEITEVLLAIGAVRSMAYA